MTVETEITTRDLSYLRYCIRYASHPLESHHDGTKAEKSERAEFHRYLEQMKVALPQLHFRMLAERARLEFERRHLNAASHWAETSKGTL